METKETKLVTNSFMSPISRSKGVDLSDDLVEVFEFVDEVVLGPSGEKTDFVLTKKPHKVESYHLNKVIEQRAKGNSLKDLVARAEATGDFSTLTQRKVVFGDGFITPSNLSDAFDKAKKGEVYIDSLSKEQIEETIALSKMSKEELHKHIDKLVDEKLAAMKGVKEDVNN